MPNHLPLKIFTIGLLMSIICLISNPILAQMSDTLSSKPIVYLLPGLGLSPAIYNQLTLEAEVHYLKWLNPKKREKLADYAARIAEGIDASKGEVILIGHSFGGITMQEISKQVPTQKVIIISSIKSHQEKPATLSFWLKLFPVYKLGGKKIILNSFKNWGTAHGYDTPATKEIFRTSVQQLSDYYFKWATQQVCKWKKTGNYPAPIVHIHGTKDKTFPFRKIKNLDYIVQNGSHVMLYNKGVEISKLINKELEK